MDKNPTFVQIRAAKRQSDKFMYEWLNLEPVAEKVAKATDILEADHWFQRVTNDKQRRHVYGLLEQSYDSPAWSHQTPEHIAASVRRSLRTLSDGTAALRPDASQLTLEKLLAPYGSLIKKAEEVAAKAAEKEDKRPLSRAGAAFSGMGSANQLTIGVTSLFAGLALADGFSRIWKHGKSTDENGVSRVHYGQITLGAVNLLIGVGLAAMAHSHYKQTSGAYLGG